MEITFFNICACLGLGGELVPEPVLAGIDCSLIPGLYQAFTGQCGGDDALSCGNTRQRSIFTVEQLSEKSVE